MAIPGRDARRSSRRCEAPPSDTLRVRSDRQYARSDGRAVAEVDPCGIRAAGRRRDPRARRPRRIARRRHDLQGASAQSARDGRAPRPACSHGNIWRGLGRAAADARGAGRGVRARARSGRGGGRAPRLPRLPPEPPGAHRRGRLHQPRVRPRGQGQPLCPGPRAGLLDRQPRGPRAGGPPGPRAGSRGSLRMAVRHRPVPRARGLHLPARRSSRSRRK